MKVRLGMWMRGAIVASLLWMIVGWWWIQQTLASDAIRAWAGRAQRCQSEVHAFAQCRDDALAILNSQMHSTWTFAIAVAFGRLCIAWLLGAITVYGIKWALAGRSAHASNKASA